MVFCIRLPENSVIGCECVPGAAGTACCVSMSTQTLQFRHVTGGNRRSRPHPCLFRKAMMRLSKTARTAPAATFRGRNDGGMNASLLVPPWRAAGTAELGSLWLPYNKGAAALVGLFTGPCQDAFSDTCNQFLAKTVQKMVHQRP